METCAHDPCSCEVERYGATCSDACAHAMERENSGRARAKRCACDHDGCAGQPPHDAPAV
jgi:hypothetical protein